MCSSQITSQISSVPNLATSHALSSNFQFKPCWIYGPDLDRLDDLFSSRQPTGNNLEIKFKIAGNPAPLAVWYKFPRHLFKKVVQATHFAKQLDNDSDFSSESSFKDLEYNIKNLIAQTKILSNEDRNGQILLISEPKENSYKNIFKLNINPLDTEDTGIYLAKIFNSEGENYAFFDILIQPRAIRPYVTLDSKVVKVIEGQSVNVSCEIAKFYPAGVRFWETNITESFEQGQIQDFKASKLANRHQKWNHLTYFSEKANVTNFQESETAEPEFWTRWLNFTQVTSKNSGFYRCQAKNSIGNDTKIFELRVLPPPFLTSRQIWVVAVSIMSFLSCLVMYCAYQLILQKRYSKKLKNEDKLAGKRLIPFTNPENLPQIKLEEEPIEPSQELLYRNLAAECLTAERNHQISMFIASQQNLDQKFFETSHLESNLVNHLTIPMDPMWEILRPQVKLQTKLGSGFFAQVHKAEIIGLQGPDSPNVTAAVKMLNPDAKAKDITDLFEEIKVLKKVSNPKHKNIINLLAICSQNGPIFVILEYAQFGNLRDFLRNYKFHQASSLGLNSSQKPENLKLGQNNHQNEENFKYFKSGFSLTDSHLATFGLEITSGLEYLHSKSVVHRDLAARNILLTLDLTIKIADFGLARDIESQDYYRNNGVSHLPWRWMSPEALNESVFTTQNDIWSFGIVLWEIYSLGIVPYQGLKHKQMVKFLNSGSRLKNPAKFCSEDIYNLMLDCWNKDPNIRPTFIHLNKRFTKICSQFTGSRSKSNSFLKNFNLTSPTPVDIGLF